MNERNYPKRRLQQELLRLPPFVKAMRDYHARNIDDYPELTT